MFVRSLSMFMRSLRMFMRPMTVRETYEFVHETCVCSWD